MEGFHAVVCAGFFVSQNRIVSLYGGPVLDLVTESVVSVQFSDSRHSIWSSCLKKSLAECLQQAGEATTLGG